LNVILGNDYSIQIFLFSYQIILNPSVESRSMEWLLKFPLICSPVPTPMMTVNGFTMRILFNTW